MKISKGGLGGTMLKSKKSNHQDGQMDSMFVTTIERYFVPRYQHEDKDFYFEDRNHIFDENKPRASQKRVSNSFFETWMHSFV